MTTKTESLVERLREDIIADAFEERRIVDGRLAERLIRERLDAADEIERLERERGDFLDDVVRLNREKEQWREKAEARLTAPVGLETSGEDREPWLYSAAQQRAKGSFAMSINIDHYEGLCRDIDTLSARLREAEEALTKLAELDDHGANAHLASTGSFGLFDEPNAVEAARATLAAIRSRRDA